jgi:hypothetical protein
MAKQALQFHEDLRRERAIEGSSDRSFGLVFAGFCTLMAGVGAWRAGHRWPYWLGAAVFFAVMAFVFPRGLSPLNRVWTKLGLLLFRVVNPVVMFVLYTTTILPMGLLMRLAGRDPLRLRFDAEAPSYWIPREPPGPAPETMKNQF